MGLFMGASYLADRWARSDHSQTMQYLGLGLYIAAEALIFAPLILIAAIHTDQSILPSSITLTLFLFAGLTGTVFITKKDFSFLRGILAVGGMGGIGGALYGLGRYEEVLPNLEKALALFSQLQDRYQQIRVWNQLGLNYMYTGQIDKSIAVLEEALKLEDALGLWEKAIILGNLGEAYQWLFNMEKALVYHRQAMALAEDIHSPTAVADICRNIGVDLVYLGELESGIRHLYTALALSEDTGQPDIKMQTLYSLALAELQQGNTVTAHEHAQALYDMAEKGQTIGHSANAYHALGLCQREMGEMTAARQLWQHGVLMAHSAGKQMLIWQLHAALAEIAPTNNLAHIHNRMAAEMIDQIVFPIEDESLRQVFLDAPPVQAVLAQQLSEQG
jgi:tetratricopeptide (TPR) repeat protein